jgi:hypothetical protein
LDEVEKLRPGQNLRLISPLAEGADRLVAQRLLARPGSQLIVPLPMPLDQCLAENTSPELRNEFLELIGLADEIVELPTMESREASFDQVGNYVLNNCDLLFALWDGRAASGRGGTGEIVARARSRQCPIAWIFATNSRNHSPNLVARKPGSIVFENWQSLE